MSRDIIVLMGVQGCGKGEMAGRLMKWRDYLLIETGDIFRHLDRNNKNDAKIIKQIDAGNLVPDDVTCDLVMGRFDRNRDMLIDGFPRTRAQAVRLIKWADTHRFRVRVVYLDLARDQALMRIALRVAKGGNRADDADMVSVNRRLDQYYAQTEPVVDFMRRAASVSLIQIDAGQSIDDVFNDIVTHLK